MDYSNIKIQEVVNERTTLGTHPHIDRSLAAILDVPLTLSTLITKLMSHSEDS